MPYVEERVFTLRLVFRCEFPDGYDGEADGYEWASEIGPLAREAVQAVAAAGRRPGWRLHPENRGRPVDEEVTLVLERDPALAPGVPA